MGFLRGYVSSSLVSEKLWQIFGVQGQLAEMSAFVGGQYFGHYSRIPEGEKQQNKKYQNVKYDS